MADRKITFKGSDDGNQDRMITFREPAEGDPVDEPEIVDDFVPDLVGMLLIAIAGFAAAYNHLTGAGVLLVFSFFFLIIGSCRRT